jgi:hypothetical protein
MINAKKLIPLKEIRKMKKKLIISVVASSVVAFGVSMSYANYGIDSSIDTNYKNLKVSITNSVFFKDKVYGDGKTLLTVVSKRETLLNTVNKYDHNIREHLYLRQILVDTRAKAEDIINRIAKGELFKNIAFKESMGLNAYSGGYIGRVDPSNLHPVIADALSNNYDSDDPFIVETERGFHILQRGTLSDLKDPNNLITTDVNRAIRQRYK